MPDFQADHDVIIALAEDECWAFLAQHSFGRLAYTLVGEAQIVPINYVSDAGRAPHRRRRHAGRVGRKRPEQACLGEFEVGGEGEVAASAQPLRERVTVSARATRRTLASELGEQRVQSRAE